MAFSDISERIDAYILKQYYDIKAMKETTHIKHVFKVIMNKNVYCNLKTETSFQESHLKI